MSPALREYVVYHHHERNHQGKEKLLLFPASDQLPQSERKVRSRERCAPQKVDPALIPQVRPTIVGCFWPVFFFADHNSQRPTWSIPENQVLPSPS